MTMLDAPITERPANPSPAITDSNPSQAALTPTVTPDTPAAESPATAVVSDAIAANATAEEIRETEEEDDDLDTDDPVVSLKHDVAAFDKATITVVLHPCRTTDTPTDGSCYLVSKATTCLR